MKFLNTHILLVLIILLSLFNCSNDDDSSQIISPSVSYNTSIINATFFQNGYTHPPIVNWHGNQGTFSLANNMNGLSIDATTGVVSWTKILTPGEHEIQVIASNSAGHTTNSFTIINTLEGLFIGNYDESPYLDVGFFTDGTVEITADDSTIPPNFHGNWTLTDNEVIVNFTLNSDPTVTLSLKGNLVQTNTSATYSGTIYNEHNAITANEQGTFNIVLE